MAEKPKQALARELFEALNSDDLVKAETLLIRGADPNCVLPVEGVAPIHIASGLGVPATKLLLEYGAEPNIRSVDGTTPLHVASTWGDKECLQLLLLFGGDPFNRDQDGCTVLDCAKSYRHEECVKMCEYYSLLLNPDIDSTVSPNIIYKARDEIADNTVTENSLHERQSLLSFRYLEEYLDWAYNQDSITEYTEEITKQLQRYVSQDPDRKFSLDVTSPDHPYLEHRNHFDGSAVSSTCSNDVGFRQDSLHVHWADQLSKTLPWSPEDKGNITASTIESFFTCPSEPDDEAEVCVKAANFQKLKEQSTNKENKAQSMKPKNTQKVRSNRSEYTTDSNVLQDLSQKTDINIQPENDLSCRNCDNLRKQDSERGAQRLRSYSAGSLYSDTSKYQDKPVRLTYSEKKPKTRCDREIQKWLDKAEPEILSAGFKRMSLQNSAPEHLWAPPLGSLDLNETDLISNDESFDQRHKRFSMSKRGKENSFRRSALFSSDKLKTKQTGESMTSLDGTLGNSSKSANANLNPQIDVSIPSHSYDGDLTFIDLDDTLPYDIERYSLGSVESDMLNRSFTGSVLSQGSDVSTVEYIYKDPEKGITLIEKRVPSQCGSVCSKRSSLESVLTVDSQKTELYDWQTQCKYSTQEDPPAQDPKIPKIPKRLSSLSNQAIREKLIGFGDDPGPVNLTTRQTYLVRLAKVEENPNCARLQLTDKSPGYPPEIKAALEGNFDAVGMSEQETKMTNAFQNPSKIRRWREGTLKSSFNYLLLDPRVTKNLPLRSGNLGELETFQTFIAAIFYVGKGKRARPYWHLYEAINQMKNPKPKVSDKVQHILDIWNDGLGVVSLHCFQSVIPVEAYTREACMVDCLGLHKLTNKKRGDYYGVSTTWSLRDKRKMGVFLLKKSLQIFLGDGERQISPGDIKLGQ